MLLISGRDLLDFALLDKLPGGTDQVLLASKVLLDLQQLAEVLVLCVCRVAVEGGLVDLSDGPSGVLRVGGTLR